LVLTTRPTSQGAMPSAAKYESTHSKVAPEPDSVVLKLSQTQLDEFRECFNAFDKDGGGSIDASELGVWPWLRQATLLTVS